MGCLNSENMQDSPYGVHVYLPLSHIMFTACRFHNMNVDTGTGRQSGLSRNHRDRSGVTALTGRRTLTRFVSSLKPQKNKEACLLVYYMRAEWQIGILEIGCFCGWPYEFGNWLPSHIEVTLEVNCLCTSTGIVIVTLNWS